MNTQPHKYNKFLNLLWLIPVITLGYIGWVNILPFGGTIHLAIDVGGDDTEGNTRITGPFDRISGKLEYDGDTFRELEQSLVYFVLDEPRLSNTETITVSVRFKDNFNTDEKLVLSARNGQEWSYHWKDIYVPFYAEISELIQVTTNNNIRIYSTDPKNTTVFASVEDFLQNPPPGAVISTNDISLPINQLVAFSDNEAHQPESESSVIRSSLRGPHTLWTYVHNDTLKLKVAKQDLNWYEEADELAIEVYTLNGELVGEDTIPDDGDAEASKHLGSLQEIASSINIPAPGAYRIALNCGSDLLITGLEVNQPHLVVENRVYLSGNNPAYYPDETIIEPVALYGYNHDTNQVRFYTWHNSGMQNITIAGDGHENTVDINQVKTDFYIEIAPGSYQMTFAEQDILIDAAGFLAFSPESYFFPRRCEVVELRYDMSWLMENVDYVVINYSGYTAPEKGDGWLVARTEWQLEELHLIDNKLSFCLNAPHLAEEPARTIRIDRIDIALGILPWWEL